MEAQLTSRFARWHAALSLVCGLVAAWAVHDRLNVSLDAQRPAEPSRFAVRARQVAAAKPHATVAPEVLPLKGVAPKKLPKITPPTPPAPSDTPQPAAETPAPVLSSTPFDLQQPAIAPSTPATSDPKLPQLGTSTANLPPPPAPSEDTFVSQYDDAPNQRVLVIAMLVNDQGEIIDFKVVIPSKHPLEDLSYALTARRQKITSLVPPLAPNETRWVEVRLVYPDDSTTAKLIP